MAPTVNIRFLHVPCSDVGAMKDFYADHLGMEVSTYRDDEQFAWCVLQSEGLQLMFHRHADVPAGPAGFAWQPGDGAGNRMVMSIGLSVPETDFRAAIDALREAGTEAATPEPTWRQDSYWGWTVRDPGGNTVEVYCSVAERPESTTWVA